MINRTEWPRRELTAVPRLRIAKDIAELVYQSCDLKDLKTEEALDRIYKFGRFDINYTEFSDETSAEALLFPMTNEDNRFKILIDRSNKTKEESDHNTLHEVGHSFFYRRTNGDMPCKRTKFSNEEEIFCDEFASQLLKLIYKN